MKGCPLTSMSGYNCLQNDIKLIRISYEKRDKIDLETLELINYEHN